MATQRYISTAFWSDKWIRTLNPSDRYLYMYLLTNPQTNIAGVYQITMDRIAFDTGYDERTLRPMFDRFAEAGKVVFYQDEWLIIPTWPKHQRHEGRSKIASGIESVLKQLPGEIIRELKRVGYQYPMDKISISHAYHMDKVSIPYTYDTNYSDTDLDTDTDTDTDTEKDTEERVAEAPHVFSLPQFPNSNREEPRQGSAGATLEALRQHWNSKQGLPRYRHLPTSMPPDQSGPALRTLGAYTEAEIRKAIDNYAEIATSVEHEAFPRYAGFPGFLKSGPESYSDEAQPFVRCRLDDHEESADEVLARVRAKEAARAG